MLVLPQTVMVKWVSGIIKWYESKGYKYTKMYDEFEVNVEDLTIACGAEVEYICDYCGRKFKKPYKNILSQRKIIKKDCCRNCSPKKYSESMFVTYGVYYASQYKEFVDKVADKSRHSFEYAFNEFKKRNCLMIDDYYLNNYTPIRYVCLEHLDKGIQKVRLLALVQNKGGCRYCGNIKISESQTGEKHHLWKGGITSLFQYLRSKITQWKLDSMKNCNYKCVITGEKFDVIHHLYSFDKIIDETLKELNLPIYKERNLYSEEQLKLLEDKCLELHYKYGYGVCLSKKYYKEFHQIYGRGNNTPKQFEEFKKMKLQEANNASFLFDNKEVKL